MCPHDGIPDDRAAATLPFAARVAAGEELQATLVEVLDLSLAATQLQWVLVGRHAGALGLSLSAVSDACREAAGRVAARMTALGRTPNGQARTIAVETPMEALPTRHFDVAEASRELGDRMGQAAARVARCERAARPYDAATACLLGAVRRDLERQSRAILDRARSLAEQASRPGEP